VQAGRGAEVLKRRAFALLLGTLAGCTSPRAVLVNDRGEHTSCASEGIGVIGSMAAQNRFEQCMAEAKEKGYRVERQE
jgi:hypothetical protein